MVYCPAVTSAHESHSWVERVLRPDPLTALLLGAAMAAVAASTTEAISAVNFILCLVVLLFVVDEGRVSEGRKVRYGGVKYGLVKSKRRNGLVRWRRHRGGSNERYGIYICICIYIYL